MNLQDDHSESRVPPYRQFIVPILLVLQSHGGSATNSEIEAGIIEKFKLGDDILEERVPSGVPRLRNRVAWAKVDLTKAGYVQSDGRGVWALTSRGQSTTNHDTDVILKESRAVMEQEKRERKQEQTDKQDGGPGDDPPVDSTWKAELLQLLLAIEPSAFERLCQRVLRQSGFTDVNVTGHSGDGGIDGNGTVRIGGLISFPILFQCKRWKGSVGSGVVRDFRGAMQGRADRGLIITTGTFSYDATKEASRDGAPPIDLIDGDALLDKLKELRLGVRVEMVEQTTVDAGWWGSNFGVTVE